MHTWSSYSCIRMMHLQTCETCIVKHSEYRSGGLWSRSKQPKRDATTDNVISSASDVAYGIHYSAYRCCYHTWWGTWLHVHVADEPLGSPTFFGYCLNYAKFWFWLVWNYCIFRPASSEIWLFGDVKFAEITKWNLIIWWCEICGNYKCNLREIEISNFTGQGINKSIIQYLSRTIFSWYIRPN